VTLCATRINRICPQRRIATAVILNSIPLATNPNGALLLTWLLDTSGFRSRYRLLAPRFTPHLSHLCTHKLASLTVLRIVNQKIEPEASAKVVEALFFSPNDHVLTDVLGDQVNGVSVVHKILQSPYLDPTQRPRYLDATKRVLIDLKVTSTQAYRRLIEEVGLPLPNFQSPTYAASPGGLHQPTKKPSLTSLSQNGNFNMPSMPSGYPTDPSLASMMASMQALQMQAAVAAAGGNPSLSGLGLSPLQQHGGLPPLQINPNYGQHNTQHMGGQASANVHTQSPATFSPTSDPFNPFALRSLDMSPIQAPRNTNRRGGNSPNTGNSHSPLPNVYGGQNSLPSLAQVGNGLMGMNQQPFGIPANAMHPQLYQAYMYSMFQQQNNQNAGTFHA
jgi:protein JSN1